MNEFIDYIKHAPQILNSRENLIDMFAFIPDRPVYPEKSPFTHGIVFAEEPKSLETVKYGYWNGDTFVKLPKSQKPGCPFSPYDPLMVSSKEIPNGPKTAVKSSVGHYIVNYVALVNNYGAEFPYLNTALRKMKSVEEDMCSSIYDDRTTVPQYKKYIADTVRLLNMADLFVPTLTPKGTSINPAILKRRDELLKEHADELDDPKVVSKIEDELVNMFKEDLKGDPAYRFYNVNPGKSFDVHAKRMFIMVGGVSDYGSANVVTIQTSLQEGLKPENLVASSNDARKGAASRGVDTQVSGYYTKLLARALQDIAIIEDDCGDKTGIEVQFDGYIQPTSFVGRFIISDGKLVEIKRSETGKYANKKVRLRSPQACKTKGGFCYTCMGASFKKLGIVSPGILAIDISSTNMNRRMKLMHAETTTVQKFELDEFLK